MNLFKKIALASGLLALVATTPTFAWGGHGYHHWHHGGGGGVGAGLLFGAVAGVVLGAAIANNHHSDYYANCRRVYVHCNNYYGPDGPFQRCTQYVRYVC